MDSMNMGMDQAMVLINTYGLSIIGAIAVLVIGWILAGWAQRAANRALGRVSNMDTTLRQFLASLARYAVLIFTGLACLNQFGVETTSIIAVLGAASLAIGLAMQGTLSNVAAGVMLLLFRPFKVDDYIEGGGVAGTVKSITLFVTELSTPDNVQILVPNAQMWGSAIINYSFHATRRVDLVLGISYESDIETAIASVHAIVGADERVHKDPEPMVVVGELADSSVNLVIRVWCASADYWALKFDLTKALKLRMDADNISIPYPQRMIHMAAAVAE